MPAPVFRIVVSLLLPILLLMPCAAAAASVQSGGDPTAASVVVFNRTVAVFRAPLLGVPSQERARRAEDILARMLKETKNGSEAVTLLKIPQGYSILVNGVLAYSMVPEDTDPVLQESLEQAAQRSAQVLELVIRETAEARNGTVLLRASGFVAAYTVALLLLIWLLRRARSWVTVRLTWLAHSHAERLKIGGESLVKRERMLQLVRRGVTLIYWLLLLFLIYDWLGFSLKRFPYTRPWGERLT